MRNFAPRADATTAESFDLLHRPEIVKRIPALPEAYDPHQMASRFERAFGFSSGVQGRVVACVPGKAILLPGNICAMQHALKIKIDSPGGVSKFTANSRIYPSKEEALEYLQTAVEPLLRVSAGHPLLSTIPIPAGWMEDIHLVFTVFPLDGEIPHLLEATLPERMLLLLNDAAAGAYPNFEQAQAFSLETAHYGRFQRCVLRYRLEGGSLVDVGLDPEGQGIQIYGKVDASGHVFDSLAVIKALEEYAGERPFSVPRILAAVPDLNLILMSRLPGSPLIKSLLQQRMGVQDFPVGDNPGLEEALQTSARIAASLHTSGITLGKRRTMEDDLAEVRQSVDAVSRWMPDLGRQLAGPLDQAAELAAKSAALPACFCHGDFRYTQLIFSGQEAGLVDFDTVCQAEPALDVGQFLAYQRLSLRKEQLGGSGSGSGSGSSFSQEQAEALCERFLASYLQAAGWEAQAGQVRARVGVYELISLVRLGAHSWQKLKGARLQAAVSVLQERLQWLSYRN